MPTTSPPTETPAPPPSAPSSADDALHEQPGYAVQRTRLPRILLMSIALLLLGALAAAGSLLLRLQGFDDAVRDQVLILRGFRLALGASTGACLAVAGVLLQGLFRNPLADPGIIGTGAGAVVGGLLGLLGWNLLHHHLGAWLAPEALLPLMCMLGALLALLPVLAVLRFTRDTITVLLFGVVLTLFLSGVGSFLQHVAQEDWQLSRALAGFAAGDLGDKGAAHLALILPILAGGMLAAWAWGRHLDLLLTGEEEAASLGVDLSRVQRWSILWTALLVGAAVAVAGNVGFVGLMVPHIIRRLVGPGHRQLVPLAALGGASFVLCCDLLGQLPPPGRTLPLGVVT
ncbi:MAG: FecCD family ABC transporter permease, partial [Planctomycetota bacterium]